MPTATGLLAFIESMATPIAAGAALVCILKRLGVPVPLVPLAKLLFALVVLLGATAAVASIGREHPATVLFCLALLSLAAFLYSYRQRTEDTRAADADRLKRARGQERRRAQGNLPAAGTGTGGPTAGWAP